MEKRLVLGDGLNEAVAYGSAFRVECRCISCGSFCGEEVWVRQDRGCMLIEPEPKSHTRLICGIHEDIHRRVRPVPAVHSQINFCESCTHMTRIGDRIVSVIDTMGLPPHWTNGDTGGYRKEDGGCWLTMWYPPFRGRKPFPWQGQFDYPSFMAMIEKLQELNGNPLRINVE